MFGRKWKENAEEVRSQAARYDPDAMPEYLTDCKDLTEAFEVEADAIGKFAAVSESDLPVHPDLAAYIRSVQSLLRKVSEEASEVVSHFQKLHEEDMKRHLAPRPNESKWNV